MSLLIHHGRVCTLGESPQVLDEGAVLVEGAHIRAVGTTAELCARHPEAPRWDAGGQLVLPGSICAHTHLHGAFARGMPTAGPPAQSFVEILQGWWRLDRALDEESVRLSAQVCLVDAIRHGTTTLFDHHASPACTDGSLDILADEVVRAGLRASLCYEVTDRSGPEGAAAAIAENVRFAKRARSLPTGKAPAVGAMFGLHASLTLSDATLERAVMEARTLGLGFHVHMAEDRADEEDCLSRHGVRVGERFLASGVLGERTLCAHCVHVDAGEIDGLSRTGTKVSHQPRSNMSNGVGTTPVQALLDAGVTVGLGSDGFTHNQFAEYQAAHLIHKAEAHDPRAMPVDTVARLAYANNAAIARLLWPEPLGVLAPGALADIVLLDYLPYTPLTACNLPWHLALGVDGTHVTGTICNGQVLMRDRRLRTLDEEAIAAHAREHAPRVWGRVREIAQREAVSSSP